jgi:hypothetical protein
MRCERDPRCGRDNAMFPDRCNVERATVGADNNVIQDIRISTWVTLHSNVPCWFEHLGATLVDNEQLGRVPVSRFNVYLGPGVDVLPGDRLLKDSVYYVVEDLYDYAKDGFHKYIMVRKQNYAQA